MKTKLLMTSTAAFMAVVGLAATFAPHEIIVYFGAPATGALPLVVQLAGALYLGFAMINWMTKESSIGGIYGRPMAMGNLLHFLVGALALIKPVISGSAPPVMIAIAVIYSIFALSFAMLAFGRSPTAA